MVHVPLCSFWRKSAAVFAAIAAVVLGLANVPITTNGDEKENQNKGVPKAREAGPAESKVRALLDKLKEGETRSLGEVQQVLASTIRDLVKIGPDALPELIEELDTTQDERMMRTLGFTLRAIGDKRAVPALIRAIPKTCLRPSSDYGLRVDGPELMEFMRKHDWQWDEQDRDPNSFHFGRPVVEICGALRRFTGQSFGEQELMFVFLNGSDHQQRQQRKLYQRCAQRWAQWWEANWKEHVKDEAYSYVSLYVRKDLESRTEFPHGPSVRLSEPMQGMILQSLRAPDAKASAPFGRFVFMDLDTGRISDLPEQLRSPVGPERIDEISAWAAREGFDMMGTEYTPPGEKQAHYVLRALGLTAWQVDTDFWKNVEDELRKEEQPPLSTPAAGLLAHYDAEKGQYNPKEFATFLFVTREGGFGAIFVGAEVTDTNLQPGTPATPDIDRSNVGPWKGRRFSFRLVEDPTK